MSRFIIVLLALCALVLAACGGEPLATAGVTPSASGSDTGTLELTPSSSATAPDSPAAGAASTATTVTGAAAGGTVYTIVPGQSVARYRAHERLASLNLPSEAVGQTGQVSGNVAFSAAGAIDSTNSKITVDLSTLTSDKSMRDNYIKQNTLQTATYPDAIFVPTAVQGLTWPLPVSGQSTVTLDGNLTVHGVTKPTTWQGTVTFGPDQVQGTATTTVTFEDFGMKPPKTRIALSVEDQLTLELDFVMKPQS